MTINVRSVFILFFSLILLVTPLTWADEEPTDVTRVLTGGLKNPEVALNLGQPWLKLLSMFAPEEDKDARSLIGSVDQIALRVYEGDMSNKDIAARIDKLTVALNKNKWAEFISVDKEAEKVRIYGRATDKEIIEELVVVVYESGNKAPGNGAAKESELVVIRITGSISPADIAEVTAVASEMAQR